MSFIDPSVFDVIVVGTGLPESIIAAAASVAGKTVLHVKSNSFYGSHFSSLSLDDFTSFLHAQNTQTETTLPHSSAVMEAAMPMGTKFNLDLSGPRVMFWGKHHMEFKSIDGSFIYGGNGELSAVPDSRCAIFKDRSLGLTKKNQLMRFFKLVQAHIEGSTEHAEDSDESRRISDVDLESPFIEFLNKQRLPSKIKSYVWRCISLSVGFFFSSNMILYAIAMADYDQEKPEPRKNLLKTKDGIESLALFHSSVGRYTNALGAMIYPIYGQGELPQAFCRYAAVKGAFYVLRLPVIALLLSKENGDCKGVRLASGQEILSQHLVINPSVTGPSPPFLPRAPNLPEECSESDDKGEVIEKVARFIKLAAFSTLCDDVIQGKKSLHAAMNFLVAPPLSENPQDPSSIQSENIDAKPTLLWKATFVQELENLAAKGQKEPPAPTTPTFLHRRLLLLISSSVVTSSNHPNPYHIILHTSNS
ncbi:hypothetical protein MKW92_030285, partial [Papaver armeniacum]